MPIKRTRLPRRIPAIPAWAMRRAQDAADDARLPVGLYETTERGDARWRVMTWASHPERPAWVSLDMDARPLVTVLPARYFTGWAINELL